MTFLKRHTRFLESLALVALGAALTVPNLFIAAALLLTALLLDFAYCRMSTPPTTYTPLFLPPIKTLESTLSKTHPQSNPRKAHALRGYLYAL